MAIPTVGEFLFDYLYDKGVTHAFGLPGDFALPIFRWLDRSKIKLITMTHEPSVGFAADGYARVKGLGVACVTYCVGGLNMLNPVACAYAEKSRVLVISGGPGINDRRLDPLLHHKVRTFDTQRRIFEEVTCATAVLDGRSHGRPPKSCASSRKCRPSAGRAISKSPMILWTSRSTFPTPANHLCPSATPRIWMPA